jgi:divalent metal cation (Fe/Co/Zn/Cd) transporter
MGLYTKQEYEKTELQKRIAESLDDKAKKASEIKSKTDLVEDSAYVHGMKKSSSLAWVWVLLIIVALVIAFWLVAVGLEYQSLNGV